MYIFTVYRSIMKLLTYSDIPTLGTPVLFQTSLIILIDEAALNVPDLMKTALVLRFRQSGTNKIGRYF